jgi:hypothetical protein
MVGPFSNLARLWSVAPLGRSADCAKRMGFLARMSSRAFSARCGICFRCARPRRQLHRMGCNRPRPSFWSAVEIIPVRHVDEHKPGEHPRALPLPRAYIHRLGRAYSRVDATLISAGEVAVMTQPVSRRAHRPGRLKQVVRSVSGSMLRREKMSTQPPVSCGVALLAYFLEIFITRLGHAADPNSIIAVGKRGFSGRQVRFGLILNYGNLMIDAHQYRFDL